jgi:hypothetical protein
MREFWNLYGEAVEAAQSLVDVDDVAAIPDALDRRRIRVGLRPDGVVVAMQPVVGLVFNLETPLSFFGDRDIFRRHLFSGRGSRPLGLCQLFRCCRRRRLGQSRRDQRYGVKRCRQPQHRDQQLDPHVGFLSPLTPAYGAAENLNSGRSGIRKNGGGLEHGKAGGTRGRSTGSGDHPLPRWVRRTQGEQMSSEFPRKMG